jgi:hypothetical protein
MELNELSNVNGTGGTRIRIEQVDEKLINEITLSALKETTKKGNICHLFYVFEVMIVSTVKAADSISDIEFEVDGLFG